MKKIFIGTVIVIALFTGAFLLFINPPRTDYYTQIDNLKYKANNSLGGCGAEPESWADGWDKAIDTAIDELNKIPATDVRPERHGEWVKAYDGMAVMCSRCKSMIGKYFKSDFCRDCGTKMDGKDV